MNGIYFGRVSAVDSLVGAVRVIYNPPYDNVSEWLPLLRSEYDMPEIGAYVAIIIDEFERGVCLGAVYSNEQPPAVRSGYYKKIGNAVITASGNDFKIQLGSGYILFSNGVITINGVNTVINNYDGACTHND